MRSTPRFSARDEPSATLDELVDRFDRLSTNLVLLSGPSVEGLQTAISSLDIAVRAHVSAGSSRRLGRSTTDSDHDRFLVSLDQLWWFYGIVAADDHGGHRQALGQYGRLVAEALRRHLTEERGDLPRASSPPTTATDGASAKR
ncbi:MAG: hypothetical protein WAK40_07705 [Thermoplasmata archaeon]